jgi:hypothetical protein
MTHPVAHILTLALAVSLSTAVAEAQGPPNQSAFATTAPSNVARVYVQTAKGVNVYTTSSTGKLTLVSGSPFKNTVGLMIGAAGSHFITVGTIYIHSYAIKSNGGIGAQVAQINSALYPGADCGTTFGGTIDRTGTEAYIQLAGTGNYDDGCDALQSYKINATSGAFTFGGVARFGGTYNEALGGPLVVAGNNGHAYAFAEEYCSNFFVPFYRDRFGAMNDATETTITFPPPPPGEGQSYHPLSMASDNQNLPTSHMAVALQYVDDPPCYSSLPPVLTSYTVDYYGNLSYDGAMLKPAINPTSMTINPQGNLLAVEGASSDPILAKYGPGLQVFHFNGSKPITGYSNILTKDPISSIAWDKSYHLYATSHATNKLYVFTITPTSITPVAGSPFTLSGPSTLVVRPL